MQTVLRRLWPILALLAACASQDPPNDATAYHLLTGAQLLERGAIVDARSHTELVLEYRPHLPEGHNLLGLIYLAEGRPEDAEASFKQAIALKSDFPEALNNLGKIFMDQQRYDDACDVFGQALAVDPGYTAARRNRGLCLLAAKRFEAAEAELRRCVASSPGACDCWLGLGAVQAENDDLRGATVSYARAVTACPTYAEAHYNLCWVYTRQGLCSHAVPACERALALRPAFPVAEQALGVALACATPLAEPHAPY